MWPADSTTPAVPVTPPSTPGRGRRGQRPGPVRSLALVAAGVAVLVLGMVGPALALPGQSSTTTTTTTATTTATTTGSSAAPAGNPGCGNLPVISQACSQLVDGAVWAASCGLGSVEDCAGDVTETVVAGAFDYFARWVAVGAIGAIDLVWVGITSTTTPVVDTGSSVFQTSMVAAQALALPLLILAALYSALKRDAEMAVKSAFLYLPGAVLGMVVAGFVITALLAATDELSAAYLGTGETGVAVWLDQLGGTIAGGVGVTAPILLVVFSFVLIVGSVFLWLIMLVRSAAILITYAFMPLAFAAMIFPATRSWIKRLIEVQLAFILAKPVIVAILALGSQTLNDNDNALVGMMQATALFFLAATSPFGLMRLLPFMSGEALAAMEQPAKTPSRVAATALGVVSGQKLAGFLAGSQQAPPVPSASPGPSGPADGGPTGGGGGPGGPGGFGASGGGGSEGGDPSGGGGPPTGPPPRTGGGGDLASGSAEPPTSGPGDG